MPTDLPVRKSEDGMRQRAAAAMELQYAYITAAFVSSYYALGTFLLLAFPAHQLGIPLLWVYAACWLTHWALFCADLRRR